MTATFTNKAKLHLSVDVGNAIYATVEGTETMAIIKVREYHDENTANRELLFVKVTMPTVWNSGDIFVSDSFSSLNLYTDKVRYSYTFKTDEVVSLETSDYDK